MNPSLTQQVSFDDLPIGFFQADPNTGLIIAHNKTLETLLGYSAGKIPPAINITEHFANPKCFFDTIKKITNSGTHQALEVDLLKKDKSPLRAIMNIQLTGTYI